MTTFSTDEIRRHKRPSWALGFLILLIAWAALVWNIGGPSYSVDEFVNVEIDHGNPSTILAALSVGTDLHPPLSHFLMAVWIQIVGEREGAVRLLPVMLGWLSLSLLWLLAKDILNANRAWLAVALLALAPTYLLYVRFEKYYALTVFLYLLLLLCTRTWWRKPTRRRLLTIWAITIILLYTDYFASLFASLAIGLLLAFATLARPKRMPSHYFWTWLFIQIGAAIAYLPWLNILYKQASALVGSSADLSGGISSFILKLAVTAMSFGIGETLYPWHMLGAVGLCATFLLVIAGLLSFKYHKRYMIILLTCLLSAIIGGALLSTILLKGVPFAAFPNHILFALPLVSILLAIGALHLPKVIRGVVLTMWSIAALTGQLNYHNGQEFLNPIYAVPTRNITYAVCQQSNSDAVVLAQDDTGMSFYLARLIDAPTSMEPSSIVSSTIEPSQVWLFTYGRDRTRDANKADDDARQWLTEHAYKLTTSNSFISTDPFYANIKTRLIARNSYTAKATLEQWENANQSQQLTAKPRACTMTPRGTPTR